MRRTIVVVLLLVCLVCGCGPGTNDLHGFTYVEYQEMFKDYSLFPTHMPEGFEFWEGEGNYTSFTGALLEVGTYVGTFENPNVESFDCCQIYTSNQVALPDSQDETAKVSEIYITFPVMWQFMHDAYTELKVTGYSVKAYESMLKLASDERYERHTYSYLFDNDTTCCSIAISALVMLPQNEDQLENERALILAEAIKIYDSLVTYDELKALEVSR